MKFCPKPTDYLEDDVYDAVGFSPAVLDGDTLYISGVAPLKGGLETLDLVGIDMQSQLSAILDVLGRILAGEGMAAANILSWTMYTSDMAALDAAIPGILLPWLGGHKPSCTIIGCSQLFHPDQKLEISVIAKR
ncbi:RidA family protein [Tardiphaga sp.]|jgi:enamine deaminase RidA (YjgF/YER057c/UK114 family)|uniref:RidA family protein n=1 Tax=Tardiphaga sp. TaxID=1926292 RepID=UPI002EAF4325|nr:Rid family hydrolase [Pseudomonadota bacterium]